MIKQKTLIKTIVLVYLDCCKFAANSIVNTARLQRQARRLWFASCCTFSLGIMCFMERYYFYYSLVFVEKLTSGDKTNKIKIHTQCIHQYIGKAAIESFNTINERRTKKIETEFLIAICRPTGDKWESNTLFLSIF